MKDTQKDFGLIDESSPNFKGTPGMERVGSSLRPRWEDRQTLAGVIADTEERFAIAGGSALETGEAEAKPLYQPLTWRDADVTVRGEPYPLGKGAPAASLPTDAKARKNTPIYSGVLKYFPDAIIAVAKCSFEGNEQHHPGTPLHWDKAKSTDHADCILRHLMDDLTGVKMDGNTPHLAKVAWRALALLQISIERDRAAQR